MYGRRLLLMLIASMAIHAAFVLLAPRHAPPAPKPYRARPVPVEVTVHRQQARPRAEAPKPEAPKPEPKPQPRPEPPKPKVETPKAPPPPPEAKPETPPPPPTEAPPPPRKPAPLVLSNVALNGGVAVQTGSQSNVFGDPTKDATGFAGGRDAPQAPASGTGSAAAPAAPKKVVVKPPEALDDVKGRYPEEHRDLGRVVRIELLLEISPSGQVVDARVRKGDLPAFDEEAKRTVRRIRFRPATRDGVAIPYQLAWTVVFLPEG